MNKIKDTDLIELSHGGGGRKMDELVRFITSIISSPNSTDIVGPEALDDGVVLDFQFDTLVMTTDSHTVDPIFFPGGNLGDLSIAGTVNDITVMGAQPLYLTLGLVIEEGFSFGDLRLICESMKERISQTGVRIVCGDTKVMPRGTLSGVITNTAGVGRLVRDIPLADDRVQVFDSVIVTGTIGDHGATIMAKRKGIKLETDLLSDVAPLFPEFSEVIKHSAVHAMKDITRGGLSSAMNELASKSAVCIELEEVLIPLKEEVQAICDILGLEPLEISCEGRAIMTVASDDAEEVLQLLRKTPLGKDAAIIGRVKADPPSRVHIITEIGGTRILIKPFGEPIPRVC